MWTWVGAWVWTWVGAWVRTWVRTWVKTWMRTWVPTWLLIIHSRITTRIRANQPRPAAKPAANFAPQKAID